MREIPPKDRAAGTKAARDYLWKQTWNMKWVTLLVAGLMSTYVVQTNTWIPFLELNLVSWGATMIGYAMIQASIIGSFVTLEELKNREDTISTQKFSSHIHCGAWLMWTMQVVMFHWLMMLLHATLTGPA